MNSVFANIIGLWKLKRKVIAVDETQKARIREAERKLEEERLELQAMNSERFRYRFLERNRPWILQHLTDLLTPRTLQMIGPDGRPNIEYVREVYDDLMAMAPGARQLDDRSEISSDDGVDDIAERMVRCSTPHHLLYGVLAL